MRGSKAKRLRKLAVKFDSVYVYLHGPRASRQVQYGGVRSLYQWLKGRMGRPATVRR